MDTAKAHRAIAWGEWQRSWRVCAAVIGAMFLYVGFLYALDAWLQEALANSVPHMKSSFAMLARNNATPQEFFMVPLLLAAAMLCGVVGAFEGARGLDLGVPSRYLTAPVRPGQAMLVLFVCRLLLLLPISLANAMAIRIIQIEEDYPASLWLLGVVVGVAGPLAAAMWRHRLSTFSLFLWLVLPAGLWIAGMFDFLLIGDTPTALPAAIMAVAGLLAGVWLLSRGGALESFDPPRILTRKNAKQAESPTFANPGAALRWSVRPKYLGWVLPVTALAAIPPMLYACRHEFPMFHEYQWLPWTPGYVMPMALAQAVLVRWTHFAISFLPWTIALAGALEGIQFLRANVLRRPIHFRLPISSEKIAWNAGAAVLGEMLRVSLLCAIFFGGLQAVVSGPNIGAQYVWPEVSGGPLVAYLDSAYTDAWFLRGIGSADSETWRYIRQAHAGVYAVDRLPGIFALLLQSRAGFILTLFSLTWTAFWQVLWIAVPLCWETGLEGLFLVAFLFWLAWRKARAGRRVASGALLTLALFFGLAYEYMGNWNLYGIEYAWIDSPERAFLGSVAMLLVPIAILSGLTRALRHG